MRSTTHTFTSIASALLLAAALAGPVTAQVSDVPRNVRVRLTLAGEPVQRVVGVVVPGEGDSLLVRTGDSLAVIPRARVQRVEMSGRGGRRTGRGLLIGFAVGTVVGAVAGLTCPTDCQPEMPLIMGAGGGGFGALLGGAAGALFRSETWTNVNRGGSAVSVDPAGGGRGVALGISLPAR